MRLADFQESLHVVQDADKVVGIRRLKGGEQLRIVTAKTSVTVTKNKHPILIQNR